MSRTKKSKILAIDPGTKEMGIAFLQGIDLVYHGVKSMRLRQSPHEVLREWRAYVLKLLRDFAPDGLVTEKTFFANNKNAALLNVFTDEIKAIGRREGGHVQSFAPSTVKKCVTGNGRASKEEVAKVIVSAYPELKVYLTQDRKWKYRYHQNMFDTVAVGLTAICAKTMEGNAP